MPYTVVSGFMSGIGVILMILQLAPLLGHATPPGGVMGALHDLPRLVAAIEPSETALGVLTLAILFLMPRRLRRLVPPQLIALIVGTVISLTVLGGDIRRIGEIPTGLPSFQMPVFSMEQWRVMVAHAAVLGMLGCIDALLTSVIADSLTKKQHNSDKELVGQGVGNVMSGLFGGLPGAGATMGTVVNIQAGGRTALSGLVRAGILLVIVLGAAGLTALIPLAVLAGIAMHVGFNIVDWGFLKRAHRLSGKGSIIMYGVLLLTVFQDLIIAVGVGLFVANVITIRRLSELFAEDVKVLRDPEDRAQEMSEPERAHLRDAGGRITVMDLGGPLIFGASKAISSQQLDLLPGHALVVDLERVTYLGVSASLALEELVADCDRSGTQVHLVVTSEAIKDRLRRLGLLDKLPPEHLHATRERAVRTATKRLGREEEGDAPATA
jgi:SulP family sulfate permease